MEWTCCYPRPSQLPAATRRNHNSFWNNPAAWGSDALVRKHEHSSGEIGFKRCLLVIAVQDSVLPDKQVRIEGCEILPVSTLTACHSFPNYKEISVGDG